MLKKWRILIALIILVVFIGLMFIVCCNNKTNKEVNANDVMIDKTTIFLKSKVNYPETFEYKEYPKIEYYTENETVYAIISGSFKSSNAFGVYSSHNFVVVMKKENFLIISYKIV